MVTFPALTIDPERVCCVAFLFKDQSVECQGIVIPQFAGQAQPKIRHHDSYGSGLQFVNTPVFSRVYSSRLNTSPE